MKYEYWMNDLNDIFSFNNFLKNIKGSKIFDRIKYDFSIDTDELGKFLTQWDISFFEFYTSILSLYLSRTSNSEGIIFSYSNLHSDDTLFKIKYHDESSIFDFITSVKNIMGNALENSMENLKDYVNELYPDYSDYIFNYTIVNQTNNPNTENNNSSLKFFISPEFIEVEYDTNVFNRIEIEYMLENIDSTIKNCLNDFNQPCCDVDIVCDRQLELLNEFSKNTDWEMDNDLLPDIILETAKKFPDNFAINDEINRITYKELSDLINSTTYILQEEYNITKSDKIILYLSRSYNIPLLTICLMKLGAVTIPVDDTYPENYIQSIINDSSPEYIIHESDYNFSGVESIQLNALKSKKTGELTDVDIDLEDVTLILYTSGSTGVPKGVELTHKNVISINKDYINRFIPFEGSSDNFMCLAKFTFVASLPIYAFLIRGYEVFIIRETTKDSIPKIVEYLMMYRCLVLISTQELGLYLYNNFDLKLDNLIFAGSKLSKSEIRSDSSTALFNAYGCTETSGAVLINEINKDYSDYSVIGKPFCSANVYILDNNQKQLPMGSVGEIVISGPTVTKQYFNNPEQTSKAYGTYNNEIVYFTNDLGYFNFDGNVVYVGRKDDQINLNGFRIEPEGVESVIFEYGNFNQVKVIVGEVNHQNHLIAYYSSPDDIDEDSLKEYLKNHLPSYMVPSFYVQLDLLPVNPNGKIDVKSLPSVDLDEVEFVKPRNDLEKLIVECFEKAFNQKNISIYDDFIQLGGTSVIAMKIVGELANYNLTVNDLVNLSTPEKIAEYLKDNFLMDLDFSKYSLDDGCPLNESQLNVYLDIIRYEKNDVYNIPLTINIPEIYSMDDIKVALEGLFDVHPILKSVIDVDDGIPCLKSGNVPKIDYLDEYDEDAISAFMTTPFDINSGLSRFLLINNNDGVVLVGVFHHLIFDGFSTFVFKQHLFDLLECKELELDNAFIKSSIYDEEIVNTSQYVDAEAFYESMLSEVDEVHPLLGDVGDNQAGTYSLDLTVGKSDIRDFLKSCGVTENILFISVFAYALSRFTGDDKVLFNILDNGRDYLGNFESIGMFVNTLPLLVDCCDEDIVSFIDLVRDLIFGVVSYNFYPFRVLAQKFNINSSVVFQYQPFFDDIGNQFFNVSDLEFRVVEKDDRYVVNVIYSSEFSFDTIKRFVKSYDMILSQLLYVDKLSDINYISNEDVELLDGYNRTEHDLEYDDILDAFNNHLARSPDSPLVSIHERVYSYGESAFIADIIAKRLIDLGVKSQDHVAFLTERSELYLFNILSILSIGAIYVPLESNLPDERIELILEDTSSKVLIVSDETYGHAKSLSSNVLILNISDILKDDIGSKSSLDVSYGNVACVLYTSGTTDLPKGVNITRKSIVNVCEWYVDKYGFGNNDVYGLYASIGFDVATYNINLVMYAGACLSIVPSEYKLDMLKLNDYFIEQAVNHTWITTQVGKLFMQSIESTSLDFLMVGGEKLGTIENPKDFTLIDVCGPTEAFEHISSIKYVDKIDVSSIGHLNYNTKIYVLDDEYRRVPIGAVGELYLSGYQIADGYLNRDDKTAEAFLKNPFDDDEEYSVLYRTGDMVRILPDGSIGIVGRRDSQVKIRGNRVELGEVESVIRTIQDVEDVTVQTVKNNGNNELVAYVVISSPLKGIELVDYVQDYVNECKPDYMVPSYVISLDSIPLNVNGKVDKRALPDVDLDVLQVEYVSPSNETEKVIVDAFEKVFNQDKISIYDNFAQLGGDSLTAIRLLSYLSEYNITVADILSLKTPKAIAENLNKMDINLDIYSLDSRCPLNESQLNVYLDIIANNKVDAYLIPLNMNISKEYDINDIIDALNQMLIVHPILGMCVSDELDVPYLVKGSHPSIDVVSGEMDDGIIGEFFTKSFDLHDCLSRFLIYENENEYVLFSVFHHIIFDELSDGVFKRDLLSILDGEVVKLDDSFLKFSAFANQIKESEEYVDAGRFFDGMLVDSEESGLLLDSVLSDGPGSIEIPLDLDYSLFKSFLNKYNVSENVLFTGAFAYTLSRFVGSDKVLFNLIDNGRDRFNNYNAIGMYVNTLPLMVNCKNQSVSSFMEYMFDLVYDVMRFDYYPFRVLANEYNINSNILFQFLPDWIVDNELDYGSLGSNSDVENDLISGMEDLIADFSVTVSQKGQNYALSVMYSDKYSHDMVQSLMKTYNLILSQIIIVNELSDINYISSEDVELLNSYNKTEHPLEYDDVLDAFNVNLSRYPNNILVLDDEVSYTYGESAYLIKEIQSLLKENNIGINDKVSVFVDRNHWILLSNISVLSLGATYVPIDENYPDSRILHMITKSESKAIIITDAFKDRVNDFIDELNDNVSIINVSLLSTDVVESRTIDYVNPNLNDVACILFTSGTTGTPKAVQVGRHSIANMVQFYGFNSNFSSNDVYGVFASVGFDVSLQHYVALLYGGAVTWVPNDIRLDIDKLNDYFIRFGVTHTIITTQVAKLFVSAVKKTSIKNLCAVGEKLGEITHPEDYVFVDVYGPTEATSSMTSINVKDKIDVSSIGCPDWNVKIYILDNEQRRIPCGALGELYISGYQVSKGYLNNPEENAKAFFDNPFDGKQEGYKKMYKTGDVVRLLPDGSLGIVGRRDSQVKIRGNRIELLEVESLIRNLDIVNDVTVQITSVNENSELVAYVVCDDLDEESLKEVVCDYVGNNGPDYMVPSFVVKLDEIPLNVNGKVDKRALPEVDVDSLRIEYVAPSNDIERDIVNAFEMAFNQENIGIYDDFAQLGGDSLTAIRLLTFLDGYNISVGDILSLRTPYAIANNVKDISMDLDVYSLNSGCPLSESQLNVYLDIIANDKTDSYLIPLFMNIPKIYSADSIVNALNEVLSVHPILGMCIGDEFDVPYLVKGPEPLIRVESDGVGDEDIIEFLTRPFDLHDSLCRFLIVEDNDDYSLFAVFHHLIFDALSSRVFERDLLSILEGESIGMEDSFLKASAFSEQIQGSDKYVAAGSFYESMFEGSDESFELLDCVGADGPGSKQIDLDLDYDSFKSFLREFGVSDNVVFTGAFAYTLSRFAGGDNVRFNIIENGRDRFNNFNSIGMFVNTLPLLVDCKNQSISSFIENISGLVYGVMKYNYYPFRLLANEYDVASDIMFQFFPSLDDIGEDYLRGSLEEYDLLSNQNDFISDLTANVIQNDDEYSLLVSYSDKYSLEFVERFAESYKLILHGIITSDDLSDINYVTHEDIELLDSYNNTKHNLVYNDILEAFNDNLTKHPENNLVSFNDRNYSYSEGAFIADAIGKKLVDLGIKSQDMVNFLVPHSELYMFCVLGVLSVGGVYVPLDDAHPDERLEFMIKDTGSKVLIVSDETYERGCELAEDCAILNISGIVNGEIKSSDNLDVGYGDLACILYTSGTTGVPKGVKITRRSIINLATFYSDEYALGNDDVYGLFSTIGFDASLLAMVVVLYSGACLSVVPEDIKLDINALNEYFINQDVTHTMITSQVGRMFMQNVESTSLDVLLVGGEKLGEVENPDDYLLVDGFGPTEAFAFILSIKNSEKIDSSSIGSLGYNTKAYVLDDEGRHVPAGAVGELYVSGYQVAEGYLNRPEENEKAFLDNPFDNGKEYDKMYRTGDMVRLLPDGSFGIVGRRDSQVKIRGNRVELGEVESVIRTITDVEDVTVQVVKNNENNELVAYVVVSSDLDGIELVDYVRDYVNDCMPEYMVPSYVIRLDTIPLNVNGKVDKRALPDVDLSSLNVEYVAPSNETEKTIVDAFEKVFDYDKIGVYDDFTRLGGDSLTAIRLLSYLSEYNITAADILSLKTPKAIAENLNRLDFNLDIYSLDSGCPLNESQLNVYLDIIANNKVDAYLIPLSMSISRGYGRDAIVDALNQMFVVHPILDMCVSDDFDVPYLVKGSNPSIDIVSGEIDDNLIGEFFTKSFDLHDCLSRFLIYENENEYVLFGAFHHIIFDALSERVFKKDLLSILDGKFVELDDSFLKVSAFANQIKESEEYVDAGRFFDDMLIDIDETGVLLDSALSDGPGSIEIGLDLDYELFKSFLNNFNVSENVLFTGVFAYTLSRFVGSDKTLFNLIDNGRDRFNNYNAIGMYVNTLPLLVDCKNQPVSSFMEYMFDLVYDVMRFDYYPFRVLANDYGITSNILFQFLPDWIDNRHDYGSLDSRGAIEDTLVSDMDDLIADFSVSVSQKGKDYTLSIMYSDKYSSDMVESLMKTYNLILSQIITVNELSDINYISNEDIELLNSYNRTEHLLEYDDVLDAFNNHLARSSDSPLVSMYDRVYSYGEGAYIADMIAKRLIDLDVEVGNCVGFLTERSELYMFAVLGILSMGATCVPLDDALPDERLEFMIKDTGSNVLIVSNETYERAQDLIKNDDESCVVLLNISNIMNGDIGCLSVLPVVYGDLACILYTSGTTGVPKGVKITRNGILNLATFYNDEYGLSNDDVYGLFSTIGFDAALLAMVVVLYSGACLSVVPEDIRLDINALNEYFINQDVTHTLITSQVGRIFMQNVESTSLDVLLVGGEKLGEVESPDDYLLVDAFGPTEVTVFISSIKNSEKIDSTSIGPLSYNTKAYVLDDDGRRVPAGAVGELYVSGYQVGEGYLNRPEENEKAFLDNPFDNGKEYDKMYRSGDMVRFLPDGSLGIVGRRDSQVKIRGNRVELSEVEEVIRELDYVDDVIVQTFKNGANNELVAYVVSTDDLNDDVLRDNIQEYVMGIKPEYMVPSFVIRLDDIPLNVNGKVDKRALPDVDLSSLHAEYVAPTTENEKIVVEAFEKVFNEKIGIYDDFVRLGGDSLTGIKLLSYIGSNNLTMADIFTFRTPEAIAKNMSDLSFDLDLYTLESGCPLNAAQVNVFADVIINNKKNAYHIPRFIFIPKEYGLEKILDSLDALLEAHPILSMRLSDMYEVNDAEDVSKGNALKELISTTKKFRIENIRNIIGSYGLDVIGISHMLKSIKHLFKGEYPYLVKGDKPPISVKSNVDNETIVDFFSESLDFYNYLSKFMIVEYEESYCLFYLVHHIIFDATSAGLFKHDLQVLLDGGRVDLDDAFLKTSAFSQQIKNTEKFEEAREFYHAILSDVNDVGELVPDNSSKGYTTSSYDLEFDKVAFKSFLNKWGIGENVLFTSVFTYTLSQFVDSDKVIFMLIENGRDRFTEEFIGMTSNVMTLVADCKDRSINSFMNHMSHLVYGASRYSYYPAIFLHQDHDFEVNTMFQFVPNWIADDIESVDEVEGINLDEFTNQVLDTYSDFLVDFGVQIYQYGETYKLMIINSNMYSDKMINDFKDTYISFLSNIINVDMSSNLSDTLK